MSEPTVPTEPAAAPSPPPEPPPAAPHAEPPPSAPPPPAGPRLGSWGRPHWLPLLLVGVAGLLIGCLIGAGVTAVAASLWGHARSEHGWNGRGSDGRDSGWGHDRPGLRDRPGLPKPPKAVPTPTAIPTAMPTAIPTATPSSSPS